MVMTFRFGDNMILIDSREHAHAIRRILEQFDSAGVKHVSTKLYVGDYQRLDSGLLVVDRKQNLSELVSNVCQQHERFRAELIRAQEAGIQIVILCEHGGKIKCLEDVRSWQNPRLQESPKAMSGERLYKVLTALIERYGVRYEFCDKYHTGKKIMEILNDGRMDQVIPADH